MRKDIYSEGGEQAVIGSVIISPDAYLNVAEFLKPEDFFLLRHSYIWQALQQMEADNIEVDNVTLSEQLEAMGMLAEIGGPAYITKLISETPTSQHAEVYGQLGVGHLGKGLLRLVPEGVVLRAPGVYKGVKRTGRIYQVLRLLSGFSKLFH